MPDEPVEFGLVMPFVVCATNGGPYDDTPYVAGYEAGMVDVVLATLDAKICHVRRTVRTGNVAQLDLIAMQHGWTMATEPSTQFDEWMFATFQRKEPS